MEYYRFKKTFEKKVVFLGLTLFNTFISNLASAHTCPEFTNSNPNNAEIFDFPVPAGTGNSKWVYQEFHHNGEPNRTSVSGWRIRFSESVRCQSFWDFWRDYLTEYSAPSWI